jgi:mannose-6-phosphate isomerase-like protein (cupin superfamily)
MTYILRLPSYPSFQGRGLKGFQFEPLRNHELDIHYVEVEKGHDTFMISKRITRFYYILEGRGYFTIDNRKYDVEPSILVEVPPNIEYSYSGRMKLLLIGYPRWFRGNEEVTRNNPDVFPPISIRRLLSKLASGKKRILGQ